MPLVTTKTMLKKAQKGGYAVGHFNTSNLEITQAIIAAAEATKSPVIIATSTSAIEYGGYEALSAIVTTLAKRATVPVALHLDHSPDYAHVQECIKHGWSSVMRDASHEDLKTNIKETAKAVKYAHKHKIPVEAEIGQLKGVEDWVAAEQHVFTDPDEAAEFVQKTGCDSLAIAIGTSHGAYKFSGEPKLDIKRLKEIRKKVSVPLVLHGASGVPQSVVKMANDLGANIQGAHGVPDSEIKKAVRAGICKVNADTDLRLEFDAALRSYLKEKPEVFDPRKILGHVRDELQKLIEQRMRVLGSAGKA